MKHQFEPIFWGDFFANTLTLTTATEYGAYLLLLAHAWEHGGRFPDDEARKIARVHPWHWQKKVRPRLSPFFELETLHGRTWWVSHRTIKQLAIADQLSSKRRAAGIAGAIKRWAPLRLANAWQSHSNLKTKKDRPTNGENQQPLPPVDNPPVTEPIPPQQKPPASSHRYGAPDGALARSPTPEPTQNKKPEDLSLTEINQIWRPAGTRP